MTELEELRMQEKEIKERIRKILDQTVMHGRARLETKRNGNGSIRFWQVKIKKYAEQEERSKWIAIVEVKNRDAAIKSLDEIIADLQGLKKDIEERKKE